MDNSNLQEALFLCVDRKKHFKNKYGRYYVTLLASSLIGLELKTNDQVIAKNVLIEIADLLMHRMYCSANSMDHALEQILLELSIEQERQPTKLENLELFIGDNNTNQLFSFSLFINVLADYQLTWPEIIKNYIAEQALTDFKIEKCIDVNHGFGFDEKSFLSILVNLSVDGSGQLYTEITQGLNNNFRPQIH